MTQCCGLQLSCARTLNKHVCLCTALRHEGVNVFIFNRKISFKIRLYIDSLNIYESPLRVGINLVLSNSGCLEVGVSVSEGMSSKQSVRYSKGQEEEAGS